MLDDIKTLLAKLTPSELAEVTNGANAATAGMVVIPNPGKQTMAHESKADIIGYGGSGGSGKTALAVALSSNPGLHLRSIIFRRESTQTDGMIAFAKEVIGERARYNGSDLEFNWEDGKSLKFAGLPGYDDWRKHAGRERDLMVFDEAAEFLEGQVSSLMAWNRGPDGIHCQILLPSNPPRSADGAWYKVWFAPWLDKAFPNPAKDGELRWCVYRRGQTIWVDGPEPQEMDGETVYPKSRTFIHAQLADNPYRNTSSYIASLQALPETLSKQMLYGDFEAGEQDGAWQTVPTDWIRQAQRRWTPQPPVGVPMCCIGSDIAQGGADQTMLAIRHDGWYAPLIPTPGVDTPDGKAAAGVIVKHRRDNADVVVDLGGGWGGDCHAHLNGNGVKSIGYMGDKSSHKRTQDGTLPFSNVRSEAYWQFREALDPSQFGGSPIALPDDPLLVQELCAPTYAVGSQGIQVLAKDKVTAMIGRSPDRADAVVMAWWRGAKLSSMPQGMWKPPRKQTQSQRHTEARGRYT